MLPSQLAMTFTLTVQASTQALALKAALVLELTTLWWQLASESQELKNMQSLETNGAQGGET